MLQSTKRSISIPAWLRIALLVLAAIVASSSWTAIHWRLMFPLEPRVGMYGWEAEKNFGQPDAVRTEDVMEPHPDSTKSSPRRDRRIKKAFYGYGPLSGRRFRLELEFRDGQCVSWARGEYKHAIFVRIVLAELLLIACIAAAFISWFVYRRWSVLAAPPLP